MTIIIINPNASTSMTKAMLQTARAAAPELTFEAWTSTKGPASIQGPEDGAAATAPLLELVEKAAGADGIIIGCFDDTALGQAAKIAACPVIGIGQAAFHYCALRQWRFSVVTTLPVSVPIIEDNIADYGLAACASKVRASNVPVLDIDAAEDASYAAIKGEAEMAVQQDEISALVLGCAGMVSVAPRLARALSVPVVDPVVAAALAMQWVARPQTMQTVAAL